MEKQTQRTDLRTWRGEEGESEKMEKVTCKLILPYVK